MRFQMQYLNLAIFLIASITTVSSAEGASNFSIKIQTVVQPTNTVLTTQSSVAVLKPIHLTNDAIRLRASESDTQAFDWFKILAGGVVGGIISAILVSFLNHKYATVRDADLNKKARNRDTASHRRGIRSDAAGFLEEWKTEIQVAVCKDLYDVYAKRRGEFANHAGRIEFEFRRSPMNAESIGQLDAAKSNLKSMQPAMIGADEGGRHRIIKSIDVFVEAMANLKV